MLKQFSICAALVVLNAGSLNAQQPQQEAVLQKLEVPAAAFDMVIAMPKSPATTIDLGRSPEAMVIYLVGGELALAFDSAETMLKARDSLGLPVGAFRPGNAASKPVAVYIVPKHETVGSAVKISRPSQLQNESLTRIEVPGAEFDLVVATVKQQSVPNLDGGQHDPLDGGLWPTRVYVVPKGDVLASPKR